MKPKLGTYTGGVREGEKVGWLSLKISVEPTFMDLVAGVCSKYLRHYALDDDEVPTSWPDDLPLTMTKAQVVDVYKTELLCYGSNLGYWSDDMGAKQTEAYIGYASELVLAAFPEFTGYDKY